MSAGGPEFCRFVRLDEIGRMEWPAHVSATSDERAALARRFGFLALDRLEASYTMTREGTVIDASGEISADLAQPCIATGEPVPETVKEPFAIRFVPDDGEHASARDEELELDAGECDMVPYSGGRIDMGEAIAETLALAANPYPRSATADTYLREAGVLTEDQAGPFAALAALKPSRPK